MQAFKDAGYIAKEDQSLSIERHVCGLLEASTEAKEQPEDGILTAQEQLTLPPLKSTPEPASEVSKASHWLHVYCATSVCWKMPHLTA